MIVPAVFLGGFAVWAVVYFLTVAIRNGIEELHQRRRRRVLGRTPIENCLPGCATTMIFAALLLGCGGSRSPEGGNNPPMAETPEQNPAVRLEQAIRSAPRNSTAREDWSQWESTYAGKRVAGRGWVSSVSLHPQEGKLFFVATVLGEEDIVDSTAAQVALFVEDAHSIALGEEEGSFLIDDTKWVQLGRNYAFQGRVSEYSPLDADLLVSSGQGNLVVIRVMKKDINKE